MVSRICARPLRRTMEDIMSRHLALAAASAMALFALTAAAPMASATTEHGLTCKSGMEPMRVMEKGRHVWRCEPMKGHTTMKSHPSTMGTGSSGGTSY
ncbi:MAG: hypothetical protein J0H08_10335 [Rhizobiales bacterium]|nr:hypothetical protein [Hyphomicrobiales bacterium]